MPNQHRHIIDVMLQNVKDISRPNFFEVELNRGPDFDNDHGTSLFITQNLIKSITLPATTIGSATITRMGRKVELPSSLIFEDVTMTLYDDIDKVTRTFISNWQKNYYKEQDGVVNKDLIKFIGGRVTIYQLNTNHERISTTEMTWVWPKVIGEIELNHDTEDDLNTFNVTFSWV